MKGFLVTHKGAEKIAALEVEELIGSKADVQEACITFSIKSMEDLFKLCYKSQSAIGIYYHLDEFKYTDILKDFKKSIKTNFSEWLSKKTSFRVKCKKLHEIDIPTPDLEKEMGAIIIDHVGKERSYRQKVNLQNPDLIVCVYLSIDKCYMGIDFAGFDLSKRNYNIFSHPAAVKGTIAYCLIRTSGYDKKESLLDCFSTSGNIPIEAALFSLGFPVNYYNKEKFHFIKFEKFRHFDFKKFFAKIDSNIKDKKSKVFNLDGSMRHIAWARKNSKIAGIGKKINFSRMNLEWLDTKFSKASIGKIVAKMPLSPDAEKLYNEFFYQAEFILGKNGKISIIGKTDLVQKYSSKHNFQIEGEATLFSGREQYSIFILKKRKVYK